MKPGLIVLMLLTLGAGTRASCADPAAADIAAASAASERVAAWSAKVEVADYQRDKLQRKRTGVIRNRLAGNPEDAQRNYLLTAPEDVKGTVLLIHEHAKADNDFWLFLPSLGKARRVAGSNKKNSFIGTQYAFADLMSFEHEKYDHKLLGTEPCDDGACWLIESIPSQSYGAEVGYSKLRSWVLQGVFRTVRIDYFDLTGVLYKRQTLSAFAAADGAGRRALATRRVMTNERTGNSTSMSLEELNFKPTFAGDDFSPARFGR